MLYNFIDLYFKLCIVVSTWGEVEHCRFCYSGLGLAGIVQYSATIVKLLVLQIFVPEILI